MCNVTPGRAHRLRCDLSPVSTAVGALGIRAKVTRVVGRLGRRLISDVNRKPHTPDR